jgi:hypothetical protein
MTKKATYSFLNELKKDKLASKIRVITNPRVTFHLKQK